MKKLTDEEILAKLNELWPDVGPDSAWSDKDYGFKVEREEDAVKLTVSKMYEAPGLEFAQLSALADLFGTKKINDDSFSYNGCETCDYGSKRGFTLTVRPESKSC